MCNPKSLPASRLFREMYGYTIHISIALEGRGSGRGSGRGQRRSENRNEDPSKKIMVIYTKFKMTRVTLNLFQGLIRLI